MAERRRLRSGTALLLALALLFSLPAQTALAQSSRGFMESGEKFTREEISQEQRDENLRTVTAFLRSELQLPDSAVAAILANMDRESNFDPRAVDVHEAFFGLCQWSRVRWMDCCRFCSEHDLDRRSLEGQLAFLQYELENEYDWVMIYFLLPAEDSEDGAQDAQYAFCQYFEAPLQVDWEQVWRSKLVAEVYWPLLTEGELAPPEEPEDSPAETSQPQGD